MSAYNQAFDITVGLEGDALDLDPRDSGNWTGGAVGVGDLLGSRNGFASAQWHYNLARLPSALRAKMPPAVAGITRDLARLAYRPLYWDPHQCDALPPPVALLVFDAAVNGGDPARWLQRAVGAVPDGVVGPRTLQALAAAAAQRGGAALCAEFMAWRLAYLVSLPGWPHDGAADGAPRGWARRLFTLAYQSMTMGE